MLMIDELLNMIVLTSFERRNLNYENKGRVKMRIGNKERLSESKDYYEKYDFGDQVLILTKNEFSSYIA